MKAMVVTRVGSPLVADERAVPTPRTGEVLVMVHASGVCHSDTVVTQGLWPGLELPRVPGHEIAGVVEAVGDGVMRLAVGDRVGVGWHGGHDGTCPVCLAGQFQRCENAQVTGVTIDGGYAEYVVVPEVACAPIPDSLSFDVAAPLMCAGITSFNALRHSGASPGDLVAVQGLGGVGHMGVQYASAMGFEVVAISRGADKADLAASLGAHHYVDAAANSPAEALAGLGGAKAILATAPHAPSVSALAEGLGIEGCLVILGVPDEDVSFSAQTLISGARRVQGWSSGTATDSTDALAFAAAHEIAPLTEEYALEDAAAAYQRMLSGRARFRVVLRPAHA